MFRFERLLLINTFIIATLKESGDKLATAQAPHLLLRQHLLGSPGDTAVLLVDHLLEPLPVLHVNALHLDAPLALLVDSHSGD